MKVLGIITGIIMCVLGIYAFCIPLRTFLGIGWVVGFVLAIHGIEMVIAGLSGKKKDVGACILGVLGALLGFILMFSNIQRFLTDLMIVYMAGGAVVIYGIYQIITGASHIKEEKGKSIFAIVAGVLSIILGILLLLHPVFTMMSLGYVIASVILMQGIDMILLAVQIKKRD